MLRVLLIFLVGIMVVRCDAEYDRDTIEAVLAAVSLPCKEQMEMALTSPDGEDITAR